MKRIIICADGTWNRPEQPGSDEYPTNVLKFARGIAAHDADGIKQVVFYDWGIGSYHDKVTGGGLGAGLEKNVMDGYRFLVHNYEKGEEIFVFGFSRGAYTVRSLTGLINNCGILKGQESSLKEIPDDVIEKYDTFHDDNALERFLQVLTTDKFDGMKKEHKKERSQQL